MGTEQYHKTPHPPSVTSSSESVTSASRCALLDRSSAFPASTRDVCLPWSNCGLDTADGRDAFAGSTEAVATPTGPASLASSSVSLQPGGTVSATRFPVLPFAAVRLLLVWARAAFLGAGVPAPRRRLRVSSKSPAAKASHFSSSR
jgi:hypothetical protein